METGRQARLGLPWTHLAQDAALVVLVGFVLPWFAVACSARSIGGAPPGTSPTAAAMAPVSTPTPSTASATLGDLRFIVTRTIIGREVQAEEKAFLGGEYPWGSTRLAELSGWKHALVEFLIENASDRWGTWDISCTAQFIDSEGFEDGRGRLQPYGACRGPIPPRISLRFLALGYVPEGRQLKAVRFYQGGPRVGAPTVELPASSIPRSVTESNREAASRLAQPTPLGGQCERDSKYVVESMILEQGRARLSITVQNTGGGDWEVGDPGFFTLAVMADGRFRLSTQCCVDIERPWGGSYSGDHFRLAPGQARTGDLRAKVVFGSADDSRPLMVTLFAPVGPRYAPSTRERPACSSGPLVIKPE